jgi:hypothetical protein
VADGKLTAAQTGYEEWLKKKLPAEAMLVACWKEKDGGTYASGDKIGSCSAAATVSGSTKYNPIMQKEDVEGTASNWAKQATDAKAVASTGYTAAKISLS